MGNQQGGAGILVISGTGSIAVGRNGENREHRCGGWGWLLDGSGSAMDIGHDALMASVRMSDGRDRDTALRHTLWSALAVGSAQELKALVVQADFGPAGFARLAPYVDQLAEAGDAEAMTIIERSGAGLADLVAGVAAALGLSSPRVAAVGGAITHLGMLQRAWCAELAARLPEATLVAPHRDACHGALLMAGDLLTNSADAPGGSARCA
jgi:glucosamine kinase